MTLYSSHCFKKRWFWYCFCLTLYLSQVLVYILINSDRGQGVQGSLRYTRIDFYRTWINKVYRANGGVAHTLSNSGWPTGSGQLLDHVYIRLTFVAKDGLLKGIGTRPRLYAGIWLVKQRANPLLAALSNVSSTILVILIKYFTVGSTLLDHWDLRTTTYSVAT